MGADGHIGIYDREKLEAKYDEEVLESFFEHLGSSVMYRHKLNGKKYITRYWGDNIWVSDGYQCFKSCYDPENDQFNKVNRPWDYDGYSADYFMKLNKDQRQTFYEIIQFMENECFLTEWEVWT